MDSRLFTHDDHPHWHLNCHETLRINFWLFLYLFVDMMRQEGTATLKSLCIMYHADVGEVQSLCSSVLQPFLTGLPQNAGITDVSRLQALHRVRTGPWMGLNFSFPYSRPGKYSRTSLLRTPGDFTDLYVVSIGRCNHGPLNQIRYTKFTQTNFIKNWNRHWHHR